MTNGNDPINPVDYQSVSPVGDSITVQLPGLSKREYFAAMAMQGILTNQSWVETLKIPDDWNDYKDRLVEGSIEMADSLIKELNKPTP
jgi:hypothetical protein